MIGAAGTGAIIAELVAERTPAIALQPFVLDRFRGPLFSRIVPRESSANRFAP